MLCCAEGDGSDLVKYGSSGLLGSEQRAAKDVFNAGLASTKESSDTSRLFASDIAQRPVTVVNQSISNRVSVTQKVKSHYVSVIE